MEDGFRTIQRGVARAMTIGAAIAAAAILAALWLGPWRAVEERLTAAAMAGATLAAWLGAAIGRVAAQRFASPEAIDGGEDARLRESHAVLQNTLEQVVLALPVLFAVALTIERSTVLIATMAALFSAGRLLFWTGYRRGAAGRALGFALTFYPTMLALAVVIVAACIAAIS